MGWETGWVIEHDASPAYEPRYLTLGGRQIGWSKNNGEALRFARFDDAKAFSDVFLSGAGRIAEHGWGP